MHPTILFTFSLLALAYSAALPRNVKRACSPRSGQSNQITSAQLIQISPKTASCNATAPFADECRNATQSAPFVTKGFSDYNITSNGEKAAILSLMLFETGDFQFDKNHFPAPGRPGQGTRNLMTFPFIYEYAMDTPSVSAQALALAGPDPTSPSISDDTKNAVRALVLGDDLSFASGMWFYKQSGPDKVGCTGNQTIVDGLQAATRAGWEAYITGCIFTTVTDDRAAVWQATLAALQG